MERGGAKKHSLEKATAKKNNPTNSKTATKEGTKAEKTVEADKTSKEINREIKIKYSEILEVKPNDISDVKLYEFIDKWLGVPYKYGGRCTTGVDCSNLATLIYAEVYDKSFSGSSASLFNLCKEVSKEELQEGDLVFFKIEQTKISHIGVYLHNNKFVHSTTKRGVMISDLNEAYYKKYFFKAGRIR
ncbi:MAG: C40 family peptidase [Bacteroidetes bacterium]|nr:C40 family peptidase [Bacteroidota bacterium]HET6244585.1 C40 family peptidase [Bacteroidia bacterium]